jgi:DNA-binding response OmpR family regulator
LIIETEVSTAMLIKSMLREMGAVAVGPAFNLRQADQLAACCEVDGALLSAHLNADDPPFSVATTLRERGIPFILLTDEPLPGLETVPTLRKPFNRAELCSALLTHFGFGAGQLPA